MTDVQTPICTDNYGNSVYIGHYTKKLVFVPDAIFIGAVIPQVKFKYVDSADGVAARKKSVKLFDETERNCNTCAHLKRIPHKRDSTGLLQGECRSNKPEFSVHPYVHRFESYGHMIFAPEDWMGMPCWTARLREGK